MIKNNLYALIFHVVICVLGFRLAIILPQMFSEKQTSLRALGMIVSLIMILAVYFLLGRLFLKKFHKKSQQLLSVSVVSCLLIILAVICSIISLTPSQNLIWALYAMANTAFSFILFQQDDRLFLLYSYVFAFLPSLLFSVAAYSRKN